MLSNLNPLRHLFPKERGPARMKTEKFGLEFVNNFVFFAAIAIFVALLFRNSGLYPLVADEYNYSKFSRLLPIAQSVYPDYLYLVIYRLTNVCGDGFLDCARMLNSMFFVAATPFIYLTARQVCTISIASIIALLALLGPINSYTAYFMPEAVYFFSFWSFTWFILHLENSSRLSSWCFAGVLVGLAALIKPHALLILPALAAYILFASRKKEGEWVLQAFRNASVLVAFTFLSKFLIAYLVAGEAGLTIFGPAYTAIAASNRSNFQRYVELFALSGENVKGHVLAICLMFGLPIAFGICASVISVVSKSEIKTDQKISFFALAVLVNLILTAGLFTALVAGRPDESITRLVMRYYDFAFPLLLIIAASQLSSDSTPCGRKWRALAAFPIGAAALYAVYTHLSPYTPDTVDSPELRGFAFNLTSFYVLSGISLLLPRFMGLCSSSWR